VTIYADVRNPILNPNTFKKIIIPVAVTLSAIPNHLSAMYTGAGRTNSYAMEIVSEPIKEIV